MMFNKSDKILYLEIMRIIALLFVIYDHTGANGFYTFLNFNSHDLRYWILMFIAIFSKFSVGLFFMISGVLYFNKNHSFNYILKKIFNIIKILIIISFFYWIVVYDKERLDFKLFIYRLIEGNIMPHLWYLYIFLLYLILLPFLQMIVKNLEKYHYKYLICIWFIFEVFIPIIEYCAFHKQYILFPPLYGITSLLFSFYAIIGYYLNNKFIITKRKLLFSWMINILTIFVIQLLTHFIAGKNIEIFYNISVLINSSTIFITTKYLFENFKFKNVIRKIIESIGSCVFGIYLIHLLILNTFLDLNLFSNNYFFVIILCLLTMVLSYFIVYILKKIPLIKKLLIL